MCFCHSACKISAFFYLAKILTPIFLFGTINLEFTAYKYNRLPPGKRLYLLVVVCAIRFLQ